MNLRTATANDADRLKQFFEGTLLPGAIDFTVLRPTNFFDHYRLMSDDFETVILEDDNGAIAGIAAQKMGAMVAAYPEMNADLFTQIDVDGSGAVDADELQAARENALVAG